MIKIYQPSTHERAAMDNFLQAYGQFYNDNRYKHLLSFLSRHDMEDVVIFGACYIPFIIFDTLPSIGMRELHDYIMHVKDFSPMANSMLTNLLIKVMISKKEAFDVGQVIDCCVKLELGHMPTTFVKNHMFISPVNSDVMPFDYDKCLVTFLKRPAYDELEQCLTNIDKVLALSVKKSKQSSVYTMTVYSVDDRRLIKSRNGKMNVAFV